MDIRQFRSELAEAFAAAGFERKKFKGTSAAIWVLPGREVDRQFWEHAMRRPWGFLLSGSFSIDVPAFRAWLSAKFPRDQHGILWSGLLSLQIANERDLFFAVEEGPPPYDEWVILIRRRLAVLPDTIEGLLNAVRDEAPAIKVLWDKHESPKAWNYFVDWATGNEPRTPPPPRLPTGQVVNVPANDPA